MGKAVKWLRNSLIRLEEFSRLSACIGFQDLQFQEFLKLYKLMQGDYRFLKIALFCRYTHMFVLHLVQLLDASVHNSYTVLIFSTLDNCLIVLAVKSYYLKLPF